jgi:hypothetical protein
MIQIKIKDQIQVYLTNLGFSSNPQGTFYMYKHKMGDLIFTYSDESSSLSQVFPKTEFTEPFDQYYFFGMKISCLEDLVFLFKKQGIISEIIFKEFF